MKLKNNALNLLRCIAVIIPVALCSAFLLSAGSAFAHGSSAGTLLLGAPKKDPSLRGFRASEEIPNVQAIDTLPSGLKQADVATRGGWLYVVTDHHVLVNGQWAASVCPAFGA
jgi:hypothetical protein